jgi:hypothetical protein
MPAPDEILALEDPLANAYRASWDRIVAEQADMAADPFAWSRQNRLAEMRARIELNMDDLDYQAGQWTSKTLPKIYQAGAQAGAVESGTGFNAWTAIHQEAVEELVQSSFSDLLKATKGVKESAKELIRHVAKDEALHHAIAGGSAQKAGREMTRILDRHGIRAVTYADGSKHGLAEYSEMALRTKSASAYNIGTVNATHPDVKLFEVFDGPDCGWTEHFSPDLAAGKIVDRDEALGQPISHPNCRRAFGPRPDLAEKPKGGRAPSVTQEQMAAQRAADLEKRKAQAARAAKRRRTKSSSPKNTHDAKKAAREAKKGVPQAPGNAADLALPSGEGVPDFSKVPQGLSTHAMLQDPSANDALRQVFRANGPEYEKYDDFVRHWSDLDTDSSLIGQAALTGSTDEGRYLAHLMDNAPKIDGSLYRGAAYPGADSLKAGDEIQLRPSSFSRDAAHAQSYADAAAEGASERVRFEVASGSRGLPIDDLSSFDPVEREVISGGKYEVLGRHFDAADDTHVIQLRQVPTAVRGPGPAEAKFLAAQKQAPTAPVPFTRYITNRATMREDLPGGYDVVHDISHQGAKVDHAIVSKRGRSVHMLEIEGTAPTSSELQWFEGNINKTNQALAAVPAEQRQVQTGFVYMRQHNPQDAHFAKEYNMPGFKSEATGGQYGITTFWNKSPRVGTIQHEFGHNLDSSFRKVDGKGNWYTDGATWKAAAATDRADAARTRNTLVNFVEHDPGASHKIDLNGVADGTGALTKYGRTNDREDFAESFRLYMRDRHNGKIGDATVDGTSVPVRFRDLQPEKAKLFDAMLGEPSPQNITTLGIKYEQMAHKRALELLESGDLTGGALEHVVAQGTNLSNKRVSEIVEGARNDLRVKAAAEAKKHQSALDDLKAVAAKHGGAKIQPTFAKPGDAIELTKSEKLKIAGAMGGKRHALVAKGYTPEEAKKAVQEWAEGEKARLLDLKRAEAVESLPLPELSKEEKLKIAGAMGGKRHVLIKQGYSPDEAKAMVQDWAEKERLAQRKQKRLELAGGSGVRTTPPGELEFTPELVADVRKVVQAHPTYFKGPADLRDTLGLDNEKAVSLWNQLSGKTDTPRSRQEPGIKTKHKTAANKFLARELEEPGFQYGGGYYGDAGKAKDQLVSSITRKLDTEEHWDAFRDYKRATDPSWAVDAGGGKHINDVPFRHSDLDQRQRLLYDEVNARIAMWAGTSGDSNQYAIAMQWAIKDEFGIDGDPFAAYTGRYAQTTREGTEAFYAQAGDWYRRFARAQYDLTQEEFAKAGVTHVSFYRGMNPPVKEAGAAVGSDRPIWMTPGQHQPELQPANSWSTREAVSKRFGRTMFEVSVPVDRVFGTSRTGFGCLNEYEYVVFQTEGLANVRQL